MTVSSPPPAKQDPFPGPPTTAAHDRRRLFLSYRRRDSQGSAGRLYDGLARAYDPSTIFRDIAALVPGVEFDRAIAQALAESAVVVVVIGPRWVEMLQRFGSQPGDGPVDFVKLEIRTALQQGAHIVPVLVDGAAPLLEAELPEDLRLLAKRQAHELSDRRWDHDLQVLLRHLAPYLQPPPAPWPRVGPRVLLPAALVTAGLYAAALLWPVQTASPFALAGGPSLAAWVPGLAGGIDGGWALLALAGMVAAWRMLAGRVSSAMAGRLDGWLQDRRVLATVAGGLVGSAPPLLIGRPVFALVVLATAALFAGLRRGLARWITGTTRAAVAMAVLVAGLAIALAIDVWADHRRKGDYDVALLLPPESIRAGGEPAEIFKVFRNTLGLALVGLPVELAPPQLGPQEMEQLDLKRPHTLLDYKGPRGAARVFIRIKYELGADQQPKSITVWPYLRPRPPADQPEEAPEWNAPTLVGPASVSVLALRAGFELIDFLSRHAQLRLDAAERARAWRQLLQEFRQVLQVTHPARCAALVGRVQALSLRDAPKADQVRDLLFDDCADGAPPAPDAQADTAGVLWSATVRR